MKLATRAPRVGALLVIAFAACETEPRAPLDVRIDANDVAWVDVAAPRAQVYEAAIAEIRRYGAVEVSSLEGGWIVGEIGRAPVRVELRDDGPDLIRVRVLPFAPPPQTARQTYSPLAEKAPQFELARRVAERLRD